MRTAVTIDDAFAISRAAKGDLAEILELQHIAYRSEAILLNKQDIPPLRQTIEDIENEFATSVFLRATDKQGRIVGSVRAREADDTLFIGKLIVQPSLQGKGIGTRLLKEIESISGCARCELFTSSKSIRNIALYERLGYTAFRQEKISGDLSFVYLQKEKRIAGNTAARFFDSVKDMP